MESIYLNWIKSYKKIGCLMLLMLQILIELKLKLEKYNIYI